MLHVVMAVWQNISQNFTTPRAMVTMQFWTAINPQKKMYNLFEKKVEIVVAALKKGKVCRT